MKRLPPGVALPAVVVLLAAICVAGIAVAGRVAGFYPHWVVFAIAAAAGVCAGLTIRAIKARAGARAGSRRK